MSRTRGASAKSKTSLSSSLSRLLKCPSCRELMMSPQMLQCGHSICEACMEQIGSRIICSECGELTEKEMIRQNHALEKLCLHHSIERKPTPKTPQPSKGLTFPCAKCSHEFGKYDSVQCTDCGNQLFCVECSAETHQSSRSSHRVVKVADMIKSRRKSFAHWRHEQYGKQLNVLKRQSTRLLAKERRSKELLNDVSTMSRRVFGCGAEISTYMTNVDKNLTNFERDDRNFINNNYERHMFPPFTNYENKVSYLLTRHESISTSLENAIAELDAMIGSPYCK